MALKKLAHNDFEHVTIHVPGSNVAYGLRAKCTRCARTQDVQFLAPGARSVEQSLAQRMFGSKGWTLGRSRKLDVCPECVAKERDERQARRKARGGRSTLADVMPANVIALATARATHSLEEVGTVKDEQKTEKREMTRVERRLTCSSRNPAFSTMPFPKNGSSGLQPGMRGSTTLIAWSSISTGAYRKACRTESTPRSAPAFSSNTGASKCEKPNENP